MVYGLVIIKREEFQVSNLEGEYTGNLPCRRLWFKLTIMKWTYSIENKVVASGALFLLCLLVLFSNYIDRDHTNNVKNSINTLYKDRLIAEDYILKMTIDVYQIKEVLNTTTTNSIHANERITNLLSDIHAVSNAYLKTKLTENENIRFNELRQLLNDFESSQEHNIQFISENANKALVLLNELSAIQLEESKLIMDRAEILYKSGKASLQFTSAIILVILLVLQALVFTSKTISGAGQTSASCLN